MSAATIDREDAPLADRIRANPRPAAIWAAGAAILLALEFGAVAGALVNLPPWDTLTKYVIDALSVVGLGSAFAGVAGVLATVGDTLASVPTLLSRDLIPNQGYLTPGSEYFRTQVPVLGTITLEVWNETFLGLPPAIAWGIRVALVYLYAAIWFGWLWKGYLVFREHYRYAQWTPADDMVDRMRRHRWGQFGFVIIAGFVVLALFAPALGPTTVEQNIKSPYVPGNEIKFYNEETGEVEEVLAGQANLESASKGNPSQNYGPMTYDKFGRFHPFGTLSQSSNGKDLFTFMAAGARVSLFIGLLSMGISGIIAFALAMITAYYKGLVDLAAVVLGDSIMAMPRLLVLIAASQLLRKTWIADIYNGGLLLALLFGAWGWPGLWRAVRGPSFQVVESEWIDAAKSYGQRPRTIMRKHMAPYITGYLLIYASMGLGGVIIGTSALSFLGLGISRPTPEWGRAIAEGQDYVPTVSWHISILPGLLIVLVVTAFNALGDGIRDAIDPQSEGGSGDASSEAAAAGGGG